MSNADPIERAQLVEELNRAANSTATIELSLQDIFVLLSAAQFAARHPDYPSPAMVAQTVVLVTEMQKQLPWTPALAATLAMNWGAPPAEPEGPRIITRGE